nr:hypothetical protein [Haloarchaeobius sp. HME9146]
MLDDHDPSEVYTAVLPVAMGLFTTVLVLADDQTALVFGVGFGISLVLFATVLGVLYARRDDDAPA